MKRTFLLVLIIISYSMVMPFSGTYAANSSMTYARANHSATDLNNNTILILGGYDGTAVLATAELYDQVSGLFSDVTAPMQTARTRHTATLMNNGKVLIAGGYSSDGSSALSSAELYDPVAKTFSSTGSMAIGRYSHTATLMQDGRVLIAGGNDGSLDLTSAEIYDPVTGVFTSFNDMGIARSCHTSVRLMNGKILIAGGFYYNIPTNIAELYDPVTETFTSTAFSMIKPRSYHTATVLSGDKVLFAGGYDDHFSIINNAEIYDPGLDTFAPTGSMITARRQHTANRLANGKVLIAGGIGTAGVLANAEIFDPTTGAFSETLGMSTARSSHTVNLLQNGKVLAVGGYDVRSYLSSAELLDPLTAPSPLGKALDAPNLTWSSGGSAAWLSQTATTHDGIAAAQSGQLGYMQSSWLQTTVTGPAILSYWWMVSSAATDYLRLTIDGNKVSQANDISGLVNWVQVSVPLPSGTHTIKWVYSKNGATGGNGDTAWLDQVSVTPVASYSVSYQGNGNTAGVAPTDSISYPDGSTVSVLGPGGLAKSGYSFAGWNTSTDGSGTSYAPAARLTMGSVNMTLYAQWIEGSFTGSGYMGIPREFHTATRLASGKVLIAGGDDITYDSHDNMIGGILSSFELYDPSTATFSKTGGMVAAREFHTATLLPNGNVLIAGGYDGNTLASIELYDPATEAFSNTGNMAEARQDHSATLLANGKVLITGGRSGASDLMSAELYDSATGIFSYAGRMSEARHNHSATLLTNGKVLIAGGSNNITGDLASAELYDPDKGTFSAIKNGTMLAARSSHVATLLASGKVLITGGWSGTADLASAELYDPVTESFNSTGDMTMGRPGHTATLLKNGKVLLAGGNDASAELYEPVSGTFNSTNSMAVARQYHTSTLLANGTVLIVGGWDGSSLISSTELFAYPFTAHQSYTVTYAGNGSTGGSVPTDSTAYAPGSGVVIQGNSGGPTRGGYIFAGWNTSADGSGIGYAAGSSFIMGTADVTLYAQWTIVQYQLTITKTGSGDGSINSDQNLTCGPYPCSKQFDYSTLITLMPSPSACSSFAWTSGPCSGTGNCELTITGPVELTAAFNGIQSIKLLYALPSYYDVLQDACNSTTTGVTLQAQATGFTENLNLTKTVPITFKGGYDCSYTTQIGYTTLNGNLTIGRGSLVVDRLTIR